MRSTLCLISIVALASVGGAQSTPALSSPQSNAGTSRSQSQTTTAPVIQTEKVPVPETMQAPPHSMANQTGYMLPPQAKQLLVKIWDSEQRIRDLSGQVGLNNSKIPPDFAKSLQRNLAEIDKDISSLEEARAKFAGRPDSEYFGFETFARMAVLLPRLSEVADIVYRYQNPGLGGDLRQAWNDLFTREQALIPYVAFLTRNHDQIYALTQGNLYNCETALNHAMGSKAAPAKLMRNILPNFKGHPRHRKKRASTNPPARKPQR